MSKDLQNKDSSSDEIDLGQMFNAIGRAFDRFFRFIASIFVGIFSVIIYALKAILEYIKIIAVVVILAFIVGYILEKYKPSTYQAEMLVKPYFDSKYKLISDIGYYNSLIRTQNYDDLSRVFDISEADSKSLIGFGVKAGPETENDMLKHYDSYVKSLDSITAKTITYEQYVENRDIISSDVFLISVESQESDIFIKLGKGFESTFSNEYSVQQKLKRDKSIEIKKLVYQDQIGRMDSLQSIYFDIKKSEAEKGLGNVGIQGMVPLQQEKSKTWEYELFVGEMRLRDSIKALDLLKVEEDDFYEVVSGFQNVGTKSNKISKNYAIVFPVLAFLLLLGIFLIIKTIKYVRNYES